MKLCAARIPSDKAGSGWYEILPPPSPVVELAENIKADWAIVGAGFAGLSAAKRISHHRPNDKVVVLDAQPVAWGASGRNSGFVIDLPHDVQSEDYSGENSEDQKQIRMNRAAIDFMKSTIEEFGLEEYATYVGKINAATDQAGLKALDSYSTHLEKLGEPFTRYNASQLQKIIGTSYYNGGIHTPGTLLIQPAGYIRGVAEGLKAKTDIYENSPVLKIESGENKNLVTPKGSVQAKNVILTINGHLQSFGFYKRRLMHVFLYGSMTRELTKVEQRELGGELEWGITPAHPMGSTVRRLKEQRILIRNFITYNPNMETSTRLIEKSGRKHKLSFKNRFPMLPNVDMQYCWSGHMCLSRNSVQVFGEIEKGIFAACCHNGLGASKGTIGGISIADLAVGVENPMVEEMRGCDEPKKLFPEPFMTVGAKSHLWWGQRKAGKDI